MEPMTLSQLADAVGARLPEGGARDRLVGPDVCIDSRAVSPGSLFVALPGERVDGHAFVAAACAAGAAAALVARVPDDLPADAAAGCLVVDDPRAALGRLARYLVDAAADLTVVGVTGSAGKTSTKDLMAQLFEPVGQTVAPIGSFNNEIGLPLTATRVDDRTRFLVAEMGARGIGHITYLCGLTPPTIGVVLNVGQAHLGEFGSRENIALAKGELVEGLPADGWAVLNGADALVRLMADRTRARVALFSAKDRPTLPDGSAPDLAVWATDVEADDLDRHAFTLWVAGGAGGPESARVRLGLVGRHQVANAAAAAATALVAGVPLAAVAASLSAAGPRSPWRMEVTERADGLVVINDAYNANPDSMIAALETLAAMARARRRTHPDARTWAVLGQMHELGDSSAEEHRATGRAAGALQVDHVLALGENAGDTVAGAASGGCPDARVCADRGAVMGMLDAGPDDIVLVKASRAVGLETVAQALLAESRAEGDKKGDVL